MKKFVALVLISICISFSCTKSVLSISKNDIAGTYILKQYSGGFAGGIYTPTDNITITFEKTGEYSSTLNSTVTAAGNYTITKAVQPNNYYSETLLNLLPSNSNKIIYGISLAHDTLFLSEGCCDQFSYTYVKQK